MPHTDKKPSRERSDGRKTLLVYLDPKIIKDLKMAALNEECNVYEIVEEAARDWLNTRGSKSQLLIAAEK